MKGRVHPHDLKENARQDLYKNKNGDIVVKRKIGNGPEEPTGHNINDFQMNDIINEAIIRLKIYNGKNDDITNKLNIFPTKIFNKGDLMTEKGIIKYKRNIWLYELKMVDILHIDILIEKLIVVFINKKNELYFLSKRKDIEISIILYVKQGTPSFHLSKDHLSFFNKINAELDFDFYCL